MRLTSPVAGPPWLPAYTKSIEEAFRNISTGGSAASLTTARNIAMTGDVTWSVSFDGSAGVTAAGTIANGAVSLAKQANVATSTVFYRKTAGTGAPEVQTLATLKTDLGLTGTNTGDQTSVSGNAGTATALATGRTIAMTGDVTWTSPSFDGSGNVTAAGTIANDAVTYAKMQNASAQYTILARKSASAGDYEECSLSEVLDFITSAAQGDILYRGSSAWARLPAGASGKFLQTQGAGANPAWATVVGGGGGTTPVIRASSTATGSGASTAITLPTGSAAGDDCFILVASGFGSTVPSGWSIVAQQINTTQNPVVYFKNLTSGDISTGTVTITFPGGSFQHSIIAVTLTGAAGGVYWREVAEHANATGAQLLQSRIWLTPTLPANSLMIIALGCRASSTNTCTEGTALANVTNNANGSFYSFYISNPTEAGQKTTVNIPTLGSQGLSFFRFVIQHA